VREKVFTLGVPRGAGAAPSLAGLKARLDGAGSSLGWGKGSLSVAGGWAGGSGRSLPTQTVP